ncbi:unnamed protein product [Zymoseptoria tritici ST99CH_3D7]|uniref:Uncharacterized protein n=1 Tax=Zymoseptoria tritici (strain ST99CH_3D7) TaxID=1276538 RepID=A0A1X7RS36_ZYMT9|nr:unnamed protein product [Zymoseptoria tritici ST99CH_3D7]
MDILPATAAVAHSALSLLVSPADLSGTIQTIQTAEATVAMAVTAAHHVLSLLAIHMTATVLPLRIPATTAVTSRSVLLSQLARLSTEHRIDGWVW